MNRKLIVFMLIQAVLAACGIVMGVWAQFPASSIGGLGLLSIGVITSGPASLRQKLSTSGLALSWTGVLITLAGLFSVRHALKTTDGFYAFVPWLFSAAILPASYTIDDSNIRSRWRLLGTILALSGALLWLAGSYLENLPGEFYIGLLILLVILIASKSWFRIPAFGIVAVNTLILLLIGIPLADLCIRPYSHIESPPDPGKRYYSYEVAKKNPATYSSWWKYYNEEWDRLAKIILLQDREVLPPFRLRPNSEGFLCRGHVMINSKGFRGPEFAEDKGDAYRIIAIGESTTFGWTLDRDDKPWPELLEQMIRERLKPGRPVQVINAGVPAMDLLYNLRRLPLDILPLKPDMIISYHGANGFKLLNRVLPPLLGPKPPVFYERPLKLFANSEYRLKMILYKRRHNPELVLHPTDFPNPMETAYANGYRQLIQVAETNAVRLVLANYSMAVNDQSDMDVIQFYRLTFPLVYADIQANVVHSTIIKELAAQHPDVRLLDTHADLDGHHEKFVDLIHLTQEGRQQIAENIFAGIKDTLEQDLARPRN